MRIFEIRKDDIRKTRVFEAPDTELAPGAARLKLELFALTSNNITYAAIGGGRLGYWDFFPAEDPAWGRTPVWGFATVEASKAEGVEVGRRVYGYFPMAESLDVLPVKVRPEVFIDSAASRKGKAVFYNQYRFTDSDPGYDPDHEAEQTLFRPLYATGWLVADCVAETPASPETVLISSASSKTAFATAHQSRARGLTVVGLTSARNLAFVEGTGLYEKVVVYEALAELDVASPAVFVDYLGRRPFTAELHAHLGDALVRSLVIGLSDWEAANAERSPVVGPRPEMFFAPQYIADRAKAVGPSFVDGMNDALRAFYPLSRSFVTARHRTGAQAISETWKTLVEGEAAPADGHVLSL